MASRATVFPPEAMLRLWVHECQRVFADRFVRSKSNDEQKFREILAQKMTENLQKDWAAVMSDALDPKARPIFCAFLTDKEDEGEVTYEELTDYKRARSVVEERLEDYNLAMFKDAVMHIYRIHRVL